MADPSFSILRQAPKTEKHLTVCIHVTAQSEHTPGVMSLVSLSRKEKTLPLLSLLAKKIYVHDKIEVNGR